MDGGKWSSGRSIAAASKLLAARHTRSMEQHPQTQRSLPILESNNNLVSCTVWQSLTHSLTK